jgi:hypothetical protein
MVPPASGGCRGVGGGRGSIGNTPRMQLLIRDPAYTDRLASFLRSLGQDPIVCGPALVELDPPTTPTDRAELEIYLRVWTVLYPDAEVELKELTC